MTRSDSIPLPASEPRCSAKGAGSYLCARAQAAIPAHGGIVNDYTATGSDCGALCLGFKDVRALRKQAAEPVPPRVHKAPRGI